MIAYVTLLMIGYATNSWPIRHRLTCSNGNTISDLPSHLIT